MALKRILATILLTTLVAGTIRSQAISLGDVSVVSTPAGATATLSGGTVVTGMTPVRFRHLLVGEYRLDVRMYGYENHSRRVALDPAQPMTINVTLVPKTRFKAAFRSMIIPGWGQRYAGQRSKALAFAFLSVGSAAAVLIADSRFDDEYAAYQTRLSEYDAATTDVEQERLYPGLIKSHDDAYDAEKVRRITMGVAIGIWGLNLLDALIFFPHKPEGFRIKGLTVTPSVSFEQVGLRLVTRF